MADNTAANNAGMTKAWKTCFVIAPIGDEGSATRSHSNDVRDAIITPAVQKCGYEEAPRADTQPEPGVLMTQILQQVITADLVVADLSFANPNVYYELAVRHCSERPVIQIIRAGESPRFDLASMRTTVFDLHNTRNVLDCQEEITRQIEAIHKNPKACVNPVTQANVHLQLGANENPLETTTAQVLAIVQGIARRLPREKAPMADEATLLIVRDFFTELSTIIAENRENFPDETVFKKCLERLWQIGGLFTGFLYSADSRLVLSNPTSSTDHPKLLICARETFGELSAKLRGASMVAYLQQYLK